MELQAVLVIGGLAVGQYVLLIHRDAYAFCQCGNDLRHGLDLGIGRRLRSQCSGIRARAACNGQVDGSIVALPCSWRILGKISGRKVNRAVPVDVYVV